MSIVITETDNDSINVNCKHCGEPIIKSTKYGMDCKNNCMSNEAKKMIKSKAWNSFLNIFK